MAFETQTMNIKTKKELATNEFAVNTKIAIDTDKPLKKVLSIKALADEISSEHIDMDYTILGRTQINVLYETENNELETVTGYAEWQTSLKVYGENLISQIVVAECNVESFSSTEVSINILHNSVVSTAEQTSFLPISQVSEDYVADYSTIKTNQICGYSSGKFVVTENLDMPTAQKVLNVDGMVKINNCVSGLDRVILDGTLDIKILYASVDGILSVNKTLDIHQEIACMGALDGQSAYAVANINSINATLEVGDKTNLVLAIGVGAVVETYDSKEISVVSDMYSLTKNISTTLQCVDYDNFISAKHFADTIVCNVNLEDNNVDEIISLVNPMVKISQYSLQNNSINIEGVVEATLIYKNNEIEEIESRDVLCPFVSRTDTDLVGLCDEPNIQANISSIKIRSGKEVEVVLDLMINVCNKNNEYCEFVKSVEELEDKKNASSAITIYVTKENEKLFDVAKALNVMPETITSQNEVVDGKFSGGQRVFVYNPLNVEF